MIHRAKNEVFGHFQVFALLDRLDIAYSDSTNNFLTMLPGHEESFKHHENAFLNDP